MIVVASSDVIIGGIITVALAALTGLTIIAYKHPVGYRKLYGPLVASIMGVWIAREIYRGGVSSGFYSALNGVLSMNKGAILQTPSLQQEPLWTPLIPVGVVLFLSFLRVLPSILELPEKDREQRLPDDK
jgi:hypothetical protein